MWSNRGTGVPGRPATRRSRTTARGSEPDFTQKHYERLAESFRQALLQFPDGDPRHAGVCFMLQHQIEMLKADNPKFNEFRFIEWVNTP